jgi:hypothetical protein
MPNNLVNAGETYAGYLMEKPLGSGSFGEVWLATKNGMKFAAKFIHAKNLIEVEAAKREVSENHENLRVAFTVRSLRCASRALHSLRTAHCALCVEYLHFQIETQVHLSSDYIVKIVDVPGHTRTHTHTQRRVLSIQRTV